jgi:hypothetical protein
MRDIWTQVPFKGASMEPSLIQTESVWVDFTKKQDPHVGDILIYRDHSMEWICHRYIFKDQNQFWVMGDASTNVDFISPQSVWGIARAVNDGSALRLLRKTPFTNGICFFQYQQVRSQSYFFKKFYRLLSRFFLYLEKWFSSRFLAHKTS